MGQAAACAPVMQQVRVRSPVGTSFLGEVFRGFSSPLRQMSGSFRPPRSPNIIWTSLSSSLISHYGRQWPEMLTCPKTLNIQYFCKMRRIGKFLQLQLPHYHLEGSHLCKYMSSQVDIWYEGFSMQYRVLFTTSGDVSFLLTFSCKFKLRWAVKLSTGLYKTWNFLSIDYLKYLHGQSAEWGCLHLSFQPS